MSSLKYQQTLPKKRMGSGALIFNQRGELLLLEPSYKPTWEIPGGVVEANESPFVCCQREIKEELGLSLTVGRLLCIDYNPSTQTRLESLMFIFDGGILSDPQIEAIELQASELLSYRFFTMDQLPTNLSPTLRSRITKAWKNRLSNDDQAIYLENGASPF